MPTTNRSDLDSLTELAFLLAVPYGTLHRAAMLHRFPVLRKRVGTATRLFVRRADLPRVASAVGVPCPTADEIAEALTVEA